MCHIACGRHWPAVHHNVSGHMKESPFGFEYSWADLEPVRPLFVTVLLAQFLGAAFGLWSDKFPSWFDNIWVAAAFATFPGFLLGLPVQMRLRPGSLGEHRVMVRRLGMVALLLSVAALIWPVVHP